MRFKFSNPHTEGLPIWGPGGQGVTYIWRVFPRQQAGYYTTFFWGNDGDFSWGEYTYYGFHPYPQGDGTVHKWEIAGDRGGDFVGGDVVYDRWFVQVARVWSDENGKHHEFYWDWPDQSRVITHTAGTDYGNTNPPSPALTWGDAPWPSSTGTYGPSGEGNEVYDGILRGIQIYNSLLSMADIQNEMAAPMSTAAGAASIWYLNINPTPSDISDKSGKGHNPLWVGDERPALFVDAGGGEVWIADDGDAAFSAIGSWTTYVGAGAEGDFAYKLVDSGTDTATWTFTGLAPGQYRVSATWPAYVNRAADAPYSVLDGAMELTTMFVDQRQAPADFLEDGTGWQDLGGPHPLAGDTLVVQLSDSAGSAGSYVVADAVRVERIGDLPPGPEIQVLADGADVADGTGAVDVGSTVMGVPVALTVTVRNDGTADLTLGAITVPVGFSLATDFGSTTLASGQTTSFTVQLDADAEGAFAGTISFASNDADESPFDFGVSGMVMVDAVPQIWIVDDGDAAFSAIGSWTTYVGAGAEGDFAYKLVGSGTDTATWTFTGLAPGQYRVSATWPAYVNRAVDAPYIVLDGAMELATVFVDQRQASADFLEDGAGWQDLGGPHPLAGDSLMVQLSDLAGPAGNYVVADAVRVERIGDLPSWPEIQVLADGADVADGTGAVDVGSTVMGVPVALTVTVRNDGTADLTLGAITVPVGFSLATDFGSTTLASGQTTSFTVQLDADAEGTFAGTISFASNDADESPFDFGVSGTVMVDAVPQIWIVDDGDAAFSPIGGWITYVGAGAEGDLAYKLVGSGTDTATWTFTGLAPGQYRVSATWQAYPNRVVDAVYTILDDSGDQAMVLVDQTLSPASFIADSSEWQDLGGPYNVVVGTLTVELSDFATPTGAYLIADAVRVERIGDLP